LVRALPPRSASPVRPRPPSRSVVFPRCGAHPDLHSFPTRRSSDLTPRGPLNRWAAAERPEGRECKTRRLEIGTRWASADEGWEDGHMTSSPLTALRSEPVQHTPVWFMRQAGRSLPEYRKLREGTAMLDACRDPELVSELTLQPVPRHGVDAAIFFSDIVVPLQAAGVDVEIVPGTGPVIAEPVRSRADIDALPELDAADIPDITESIQRITAELGEATPLIGFAGAPFT